MEDQAAQPDAPAQAADTPAATANAEPGTYDPDAIDQRGLLF